MLAMSLRSVTVAFMVISSLSACGSHVREAQNTQAPAGAVVRDPENPYWQARPLKYDAVDPAHGLGMR